MGARDGRGRAEGDHVTVNALHTCRRQLCGCNETDIIMACIETDVEGVKGMRSKFETTLTNFRTPLSPLMGFPLLARTRSRSSNSIASQTTTSGGAALPRRGIDLEYEDVCFRNIIFNPGNIGWSCSVLHRAVSPSRRAGADSTDSELTTASGEILPGYMSRLQET